jgi:hypothetical protein
VEKQVIKNNSCLSAWGRPLAVQVFLPAALDLGQDLLDHDVFRGGLAERGIQSVQQVGANQSTSSCPVP